MSTVSALAAQAAARLSAVGSPSARLDAELLLGFALGVDRVGVLAHPDAPVPVSAAEAFEAYVARREIGEPVAYIRGFREFHGLAIVTDARALIPRPETELLVDAAIAEVAGRLTSAPRDAGSAPLRLADVGTGSGAIAVAVLTVLRKRRMDGHIEITAADISPDALDLARENAVGHGVADRMAFREGDLLGDGPAAGAPGDGPAAGAPGGGPAGDANAGAPGDGDAPSGERPFDIICANLPYVATPDMDGLARDLSFEPRSALDGGPDGLDVIRRLLAQLPRVLADDGVALLEIGAGQGATVVEATAAILPGWRCVVQPDLAGLPRLARVERAGPGVAGVGTAGFGIAGTVGITGSTP